jgi:hypothetical protein
MLKDMVIIPITKIHGYAQSIHHETHGKTNWEFETNIRFNKENEDIIKIV